jgi:L-threonylcarbamoyladenylate synthase
MALALTRTAGPITSTSANPSGMPPARTPREVSMWNPDIDAILDGGETPGGMPSTLIDLTAWPPKLLREGVIPFSDLIESL